MKVHNGYKGGFRCRSNPKAKPRDGPWKGREESERMEEEMMILMEGEMMILMESDDPEPRRRQPRDTQTMAWVQPRRGQATNSVEAIVVHGIACSRPIEETLGDMSKVLGDGVVVGARWLLESSRRVKCHSSVVIYLGQAVGISRRGQKVILYGKIHLVEEYYFDRKKVVAYPRTLLFF